MVENLQGYIKRQGAKYTHKVGLLKELKETGGTETTKEVMVEGALRPRVGIFFCVFFSDS
jgi:hypothetical protein